MIRLIQRRLIIPRGDTGTFTIPVVASKNTGDVAVFTIFSEMTKKKIYEKIVAIDSDTITVEFAHGDTVNLPVGKYVWDIKFYKNPVFVDDVLVNGDEIDSYYAAFTLPVCEIRQTGDTLLTADDAPTATIAPEYLNIVNAAISEALYNKNLAVESAAAAETSAANASTYLADTLAAKEIAEARVNEIENLSVEVNTGAEGSNASVSYTPATGILSFQIPRGDTGNGIASCVLNADFTLTINYTDGTSLTTVPIRGDTPHLTIGEVTEGPNAIATITGTDASPILNLTLPNANVPTRVSQLENDAGYLTQHQDLSDYVQKTDYATASEAGIVKIGAGLGMDGSFLTLYKASNNQVKQGTASYSPIVPSIQERSTFYGLAKAAGDTTQSQSSNAIGAYTDEAKAAIQQMLDVPSSSDIPTQVSELTNDAGYLTTETDPTVPAWAKAATKPTYTAAEVGAPTVSEMNSAISNAIGNINSFDMAVVQALPTEDISTHTIYLVPKTGETNNVYDEYVYINNAWEMVGNTQIDLSNYVQKTDYATSSKAGIIKVGSGLYSQGNAIHINAAPERIIKLGTVDTAPIVTSNQHTSTFYGLAKAAGDTTQSQSDNAVGTYTDEAKAAIQTMLDVPTKADIPTKTSDLTNDSGYITDISGKADINSLAAVATSGDYNDLSNKPTVPVQDVQVNGVSVLTNGVANVPMAGSSSDNPGVVWYNNAYGVGVMGGRMTVQMANASQIKSGDQSYKPIVPSNQDISSFYGLAKAAGSDEKNSTLPVGQYTDAAKEAIQSMLGITQMLAPTNPNLVASQPYSIGEVFAANGHLYKATAAIAQDAAIIPDTNCEETTMAEAGGKIRDVQVNGTSVVSNGVANVPLADRYTPGVIRINPNYGFDMDGTAIMFKNASDVQLKTGKNQYRTITPITQHQAAFFGLAKAAGADMKDIAETTVGVYPAAQQTAIKAMLGVEEGLKVVRLI